uniref:Fe2OG dioxygenase domain-containing protein n=1 Tax=Zooxanthella nutricula TaxID=1333877 RepID=A0A7S2Q6J3_9DINO
MGGPSPREAAPPAVGGAGSSVQMGYGGTHSVDDAQLMPPGVVEPARAFVQESRVLSGALCRVVEMSLGVPPEELRALVDVDGGGIRIAHYPALDDTSSAAAARGAQRYGAHVDSGGVTVLSLDTSNPGGLQVDLSHAGIDADEACRDWADVPHVEGALVCNVGALLCRWTRGKWRASVHRVLTGDASRQRISLVTSAVAPRADAPPTAGFSSCIGGAVGEEAEVVIASDFLRRRVALHRSEYADERGLTTTSALQEESARVKALKV